MVEVLDAPNQSPAVSDQGSQGLDPRAAGYAHRAAIAKRFGQRISSGDAVFMTGATASQEMPRTISAGADRPITGFNRWMLLQVMSDKGWKDPRFFTPQQIESSGWGLHQNAQPVVLQFVKTTDAKGLSLAIPEVQRFAVYNASQIDGVEKFSGTMKQPSKALASAMVEEDFEPGADLVDALSEWVAEQYSGQVQHEHAGHLKLVQAMTVSAVLSNLSLTAQELDQLGKLQQHWASPEWSASTQELIAQDPSMFFDAVRVAEQISGQIVSLTRLAGVKLQTGQDLAKEQSAPEMETTQAPVSRLEKPTPKSAYQLRLEEMFANREAVLAVPMSEKDRARSLGAVFFGQEKLWFVPQGMDLSKFAEWDPKKHCLGKTASDDVVIAEFEKELASFGLMLESKSVIADGQWHNVRVNTKASKNSAGAYLLDLKGSATNGTPVGQINNKHSGEHTTWHYNGPLLTPEQRARMRAEAEIRAAAADLARGKAQDLAAVHAEEILAKGVPAFGHAYVHKKGMNPAELMQVPGKVLLEYDEFYGESGHSAIKPGMNYLVIPMQNAQGAIRAVQAIGEDGSKTFMRGGQKKGTMTLFGAATLQSLCESIASQPDQLFPCSYVEGFATGASLYAGTGEPVVITWDAGNLEAVVADVAGKLPANMVPVLAVDNDQFHVERALGFLASKVGVNPNSDRGSMVEVFSGQQRTRMVSLGDAVADGEWKQAPGGRYRMNLVYEPESTEVNAIEMEVHITGEQRAMKMNFNNRGVEAGISAMRSLNAHGNPDMLALMLIPEFRGLNQRPTDWNDLHKLSGLGAVNLQFKDCLRRAGLVKEPAMELNQHKGAEIRQSGMER